MVTPSLSERNYQLLRALVDRYIRDGIPVGSKALATDSVVKLSSASIRNVMSELEEQGYLSSPHTSAGRVPTAKGYRLFVDSVVIGRQFNPKLIDSVQQQLDGKAKTELAENASSILSDLTLQAGLVMLPSRADMAFQHLEFLPLSSNRVLVILVLDQQEVQNLVIHTDRDYSREELLKAAGFVNEHFGGCNVREVRSRLLESMARDRSSIDELMSDAMAFAEKALEEVDGQEDNYVIAGQANLLQADSMKVDNSTRLRELFEAFQQKKDILHLMQSCANSPGIQVFIGEEAGYEVLEDFSVITAPYESGTSTVGVLGVIGPTRMAYEKVVPLVDITAKLLSAALKN